MKMSIIKEAVDKIVPNILTPNFSETNSYEICHTDITQVRLRNNS